MRELYVMNEEWDNLIILDACRYDYFENTYHRYLDGELEKRKSLASHTSNWLIQNFADDYHGDTVYISGHPDVNSKGIEAVEGFKPTDHFYRILDVWDKRWNENLNTVPPSAVCKATKLAKIKYPDKRVISHFLQPHYPYLESDTKSAELSPRPADQKKEESLLSAIIPKRMLARVAIPIFGWKNVVRLGDYANLRWSGVREVAHEHGDKRVKKAYERNLKVVLEEVSTLVNGLPGKTVITSDHGELLGEGGLYGHAKWSNHPFLRHVPWLTVNY